MKRRIIIGPCRSGTTMVYKAFLHHPDVKVYGFQTIKEGLRETGIPDYSFYSASAPEDSTLVTKETVGHSVRRDCLLPVFPEEFFVNAVKDTRPLFIFRDPIETYSSWKRNKLVPKDPSLFILAYNHTYSLFERASNLCSEAQAVTYEDVCSNPSLVLENICSNWDLSYNPAMLNWSDSFGGVLDEDGVKEGHYTRVSSADTIESKKETQPEISVSELELLKKSTVMQQFELIKEKALKI